jgi:hypothetical protein
MRVRPWGVQGRSFALYFDAKQAEIAPRGEFNKAFMPVI